MNEIIIEYIGYGLYEASVKEIDIRGVGRTKCESLENLVSNIKENDEVTV